VLDPDRNPVAIDVTLIVDRDIPLGSAFWEGDLDGLPGSAQMPDQDVYEAVIFKNVPDRRGRRFYREVHLIRKKDVL
jgi:hypothetical protein